MSEFRGVPGSSKLPERDQRSTSPQCRPWCVRHSDGGEPGGDYQVCHGDTLELEFPASSLSKHSTTAVHTADVQLVHGLDCGTLVGIVIDGVGEFDVTPLQAEALAFSLLSMVEHSRGHEVVASAYRTTSLAVLAEPAYLAGAR